MTRTRTRNLPKFQRAAVDQERRRLELKYADVLRTPDYLLRRPPVLTVVDGGVSKKER